MAHSIVRTLLASGAATALIAIPTACSFSIGTSHSHSVSKAEVARQITAKMTDAAGNKPESVTCPSDLPAEVGAELNCEMKIKDRTFNVNVTVTSVDGSDVKFDMVGDRRQEPGCQHHQRQTVPAGGRQARFGDLPRQSKGRRGSQTAVSTDRRQQNVWHLGDCHQR